MKNNLGEYFFKIKELYEDDDFYDEEIDILFHYVKELLVDGDWSSYLLEYDAVIGFTHRDELLDAIDDHYKKYKIYKGMF